MVVTINNSSNIGVNFIGLREGLSKESNTLNSPGSSSYITSFAISINKTSLSSAELSAIQSSLSNALASIINFNAATKELGNTCKK